MNSEVKGCPVAEAVAWTGEFWFKFLFCVRGEERAPSDLPHAPPSLTHPVTAEEVMGNSCGKALRQQAQAQQFWSCLSLQISSERGHGQTEALAVQKAAGNTAGACSGRRENADRETLGDAGGVKAWKERAKNGELEPGGYKNSKNDG